MMMDVATWGMGPLASAPTMTGYGGIGSGIPDNIPDDDIEGLIDGFGLFQDNGEFFDMENDSSDLFTSHPAPEKDNNENKSPKLPLTNLPIVTNDRGTVVAVPEEAISAPPDVRSPQVTISTPRDVRSINFTTTMLADTKDCNVALPQPPQLLTSRQSPLNCTSDNKHNFQSMLDQQRETILRNQKIIDAQKSELQGKVHQPSVPSPLAPTSGSKTTATYPLARAALKKADEQVITGSKNTKGTKRKVVSPPNDMTVETNSYKKWKLTPAGATKLRAVDSTGIEIYRNPSKQEDVSVKSILSPGELEVRRERNRKHAKKSRLRKKSLTSELEQSLEDLREENTNLRKLIEEYIAKKKKKAAATPVEALLEQHRVRSHEHFIKCIVAKSCTVKSKNGKRKTEDKTSDENPLSSSGRGIVVDDKTLKVLKGLSKSINTVTDKPQKK